MLIPIGKIICNSIFPDPGPIFCSGAFPSSGIYIAVIGKYTIDHSRIIPIGNVMLCSIFFPNLGEGRIGAIVVIASYIYILCGKLGRENYGQKSEAYLCDFPKKTICLICY